MRSKLIYLVIFTIFINLYKRFVFPFSIINGTANIYLTPKIYLTDILLFSILIVSLFPCILRLRGNNFAVSIKSCVHGVLTVARSNILLTLFFLAALLSAIVSKNPTLSYYSSLRLALYIVLFLYIRKTIILTKHFNNLVWAASGAVLFTSLLALVQWQRQQYLLGFFPFGEPAFSLSFANSPLVNYFGVVKLRAFGTFSHPNILGGFLSIAVIWLLDFFILSFGKFHGSFKSFYLFGVTLLGILALFFSFSQGAWGALVAGLLLYLIIRLVKLPRFYFLRSPAYVIPLILGLLLTLFVIYKLPLEATNTRRTELIKTSIEMFKAVPILGVGLGNFVKFSTYFWKEPVHNIYLLILSETGLLGFIPFILLICFSLKSSFGKISISPVIFVSVTQIIFLGLFDHYLMTSQAGNILFWMVLALSFSRGGD